MAIGDSASASAQNGLAIGNDVSAKASYSLGLGKGTSANIASGDTQSTIGDYGAIAIGFNLDPSSGNGSAGGRTLSGDNPTARGERSIAIGSPARVINGVDRGVALGAETRVQASDSMALGHRTKVASTTNLARIGDAAETNGPDQFAHAASNGVVADTDMNNEELLWELEETPATSVIRPRAKDSGGNQVNRRIGADAVVSDGGGSGGVAIRSESDSIDVFEFNEGGEFFVRSPRRNSTFIQSDVPNLELTPDDAVRLDTTLDMGLGGGSAKNPISNIDMFNIMSVKSSEPSSPSDGDIYLDDGSNTSSGNYALRVYNGTSWVDMN